MQMHLTALLWQAVFAANASIRHALESLCADEEFSLIAPPLKYCTDNAAMIALAGAQRLANGHMDDLSVRAAAALALGRGICTLATGFRVWQERPQIVRKNHE